MTPEPNRAPPALILASASASRAAMLRNAGLTVTIAPAGIDEDTVKRSVRGEGGAVADAAPGTIGLPGSPITVSVLSTMTFSK